MLLQPLTPSDNAKPLVFFVLRFLVDSRLMALAEPCSTHGSSSASGSDSDSGSDEAAEIDSAAPRTNPVGSLYIPYSSQSGIPEVQVRRQHLPFPGVD